MENTLARPVYRRGEPIPELLVGQAREPRQTEHLAVRFWRRPLGQRIRRFTVSSISAKTPFRVSSRRRWSSL
ncbi:hypothetical protein [Novosphingobium gossypii]|uniref:hypothetical protein n=1 Tax=Novosphingobium gossypii TaxID=1604774 RepID=UPI003D19C4C5